MMNKNDRIMRTFMKFMIVLVAIIFILVLAFGICEFIIVMKYATMPVEEVPLWVLFFLAN